MNEITINNIPVSVKEWNGQRVVTLKDIDTVHGRAKGTARRNFNKNKKHLIEGVDFYIVKPKDVQTYEFRTSEINNRGTTLMTETGYLMLVKSFTDDLAWDVQRQLVNSYFTVKQIADKSSWDSLLNDDEFNRISDQKRHMEVLRQYHLLKSGVLLKRAEFEMAQSDLLRCVADNPWITEADQMLRLEDAT